MDTLNLISKLWPIIVTIISMAGAIAVQMSKIKSLESQLKDVADFKKYLFDEQGTPIYLSVQAFREAMNQRNQTIAALSKLLEGTMRSEDHGRVCRVVQLELAAQFKIGFDDMAEKLTRHVDDTMGRYMRTIESILEKLRE